MLRIIDGELVCKDGSDVKEYLRNYAIERGMDEDTPVVLLQRSGYKILIDASAVR